MERSMPEEIAMLAYKFEDHCHKIQYPVIVQPKIDGVRMVWSANLQAAITRNGKRIYNVPHIEQSLKMLQVDGFDGEIYQKGLDFETINGLVRRSRNLIETELEYWVFDWIHSSLPCKRRLEDLQKKLTEHPEIALTKIKRVPWDYAKDQAEVYRFMNRWVQEGFEGVMVRDPQAMYQFRRTQALLKLKPWKFATAKVLGWIAGKGKHEGSVGALEIQAENGSWKCEVGTGFKDDERTLSYFDSFFSNRLIQIKYQELSKYGVPRFPVFVRVVS